LHSLFGLSDDRKASGQREAMETSMGKRKTSMDTSMGNRETSMGNMSRSNMTNGVSIGTMGNMGMGNMSHSGLVDSDMVLVNDRGLDDMLNGMDLVRLRDSIGLGYLNGVGLGDVFQNFDFLDNRDGVGHGNLDLIFVNLKLGLNAGHLRGNHGVGPDRGSDLLDGDSVSWGGSLVGRCWGNGSIGQRGSRDDWRGNRDSRLASFGRLSYVSVRGGLVDCLLLDVGVSCLHSLGAHLDLAVADNLMVGVGYRRTSMDMLLHGVTYHSRCSMKQRGGMETSMGKGETSMNTSYVGVGMGKGGDVGVAHGHQH